MNTTVEKRNYWRHTLLLTFSLLGIWLAVTFITSFYASELNQITFLGFPLGFYMGAQGALLIYLLIVWFYAKAMDILDQRFQQNEISQDQ